MADEASAHPFPFPVPFPIYIAVSTPSCEIYLELIVWRTLSEDSIQFCAGIMMPHRVWQVFWHFGARNGGFHCHMRSVRFPPKFLTSKVSDRIGSVGMIRGIIDRPCPAVVIHSQHEGKGKRAKGQKAIHFGPYNNGSTVIPQSTPSSSPSSSADLLKVLLAKVLPWSRTHTPPTYAKHNEVLWSASLSYFVFCILYSVFCISVACR